MKAAQQHIIDTTPTAATLQPTTLVQPSFFKESKKDFLSPAFLQPKLSINTIDDPYEREADTVAEQVVNGNTSTIQRKCSTCAEEEKIQRQTEEVPVEEEEKDDRNVSIQTRRSEAQIKPAAQSFVAEHLSTTRGNGQPIPETVRTPVEAQMGADFRHTRIHTDHTATQMNRALGAEAFATGNDIYFNEGRFQPETSAGQRLLAHELTHTVQQGAAPVKPKSETKNKAQQSQATKTQSEDRASANGDILRGVIKPTEENNLNNRVPSESSRTTATPTATVGGRNEPSTAIPLSNGGGIVEGGTPPEAPALEAENTGELIDALGSVGATGFIQSMNQAGSVLSDIQHTEHTDLQANLPQIEQPTGLPTTVGDTTIGGEAILDLVPIEEPVIESESGNILDAMDMTPLSFPALPFATIPTPRPASADDVNFGLNVRNAISDLPTSDETIDTSAGERPQVDLSGAADPAQNNENEAQYAEQITTEGMTADAAVQEDFGENNIFPRREIAQLRAQTELSAPPTPVITELGALPSLPASGYASFDNAAREHLQQQIDEQTTRHDTERTRMEADSEQERQAGLERIEQENQATRTQQQAGQQRARGEVEQHRDTWRQENEQIRQQYTEGAEDSRRETDEQINTQITETDTAVDTRLTQAETEAQTEQQRVEGEAERERREAERASEDRSWWERAADAISDFFDVLRDALNTLFDGLRAFVRGVIDLAKGAVNALIDLARDAIVGLIRAFGEALKALVNIALAAFPEIAERINALIDSAVEAAVEVVNELADALKEFANAVLDAIGAVLDTILAAYQAIANAILDVLEALALFLLDAMRRIGYLVDAASEMPDHFWGKVQEETIGIDPTQPLPFERTTAPTERDAANSGVRTAVETGAMTSEDASLLTRRTFTAADFEVDAIPTPDFDPEFIQNLQLPENGEMEFGHSSDSEHSTESLIAEARGTSPDTEGGEVSPETSTAPETAEGNGCPSPDTPAEGNPCAAGSGGHELAATPQEIPEDMRTCGPLTPSERRSFMFAQMRHGIEQWFDCHKVELIIGLIAVLLGVIALEILTGGAITAALPFIMEIIGAIMLGAAMVRISGFLGTYLSEGWAGNITVAAQNLAQALAAGAVELIFALIFNIGAVIRALRSGLRGATRAAVTAARRTVTGVIRATRELALVAREGTRTAIRNGRFLIRGLQRGFSRGAHSLDDLARRLLTRFRFRRFRIRRRGRWFALEGYINPWVVIMEGPMAGELEHVGDDVARGIRVGGEVTTESGRRAILVGLDSGQQVVRGIEGASRLVSALDSNPALRQIIVTLASHPNGEAIIRALSRLESGNFHQIAQVLEHLSTSRVTGLSRVISDMVAGGNLPRGANFVLEYLAAHPNILHNITELERTLAGGARRIDAVAGSILYEFKNWGDLSHASEMVRQMATDLRLGNLSNMRYVISSRAGSREAIIQGLRATIENTANLTRAQRRTILNTFESLIIIH